MQDMCASLVFAFTFIVAQRQQHRSQLSGEVSMLTTLVTNDWRLRQATTS